MISAGSPGRLAASNIGTCRVRCWVVEASLVATSMSHLLVLMKRYDLQWQGGNPSLCLVVGMPERLWVKVLLRP